MNEKPGSVTEMTEVSKENSENNEQIENKETPNTRKWSISSSLNAILNFFAYLTVEPFMICYILPSAISGLAVQRLNIEKACRSDLNYSDAICLLVRNGDAEDNITIEAQITTSKIVSDMTAWQYPVQNSIPTIIILFVGAWSDRTGNRKALMLIPLIGEIISSFGLILTTYFFLEWPLWATALIEALPSALSGGSSIAFMGSYSYIADVTTLESRTFRIGFVAVIVSLVLPFGISISGVLTEAVGYYGVFGLNMILYILGFIHTYFRVHNVRNQSVEGNLINKIIDFFHPRNAWDSISIMFLTPLKQRIQTILVLWAHIVILGPVIGELSVLTLYALNKFSMNVVDLSLFITYSTLMGTAGTLLAVTLFSKHLKMHDALLGIIAATCQTVSSIVYALAPTKAWLFSGPVFNLFGTTGVTATRSLGTKVVDPDKVGKICSLLGLAESLVLIIYTPIYSKLFTNTVTTLPGAVYFLGAAMTVPAFFLFGTLYKINKKQERDVVQNPELKEMHAHDNQIATP
ncbi:proton-coupled folate transporter [Bombyx mori]|uniref:Adenylate cyclase n=1 Tax=Bombyx mori TaxID=7091 RepID=A0A8R2ARP8_BOMMO|nr:proton-coupled folate transporter [Bombyx mori]